MEHVSPFPAELWAAGRTLGDPHLSPDGTMVAFVSTVGGTAQLMLRAVEDGAEGPLPCLPSVKRAGASAGGVFDWLPDGDGLVYLGTDGRLHRLDFTTWQCAALTSDAAPISGVAVSPDGERVAYVVDTQDIAVTSTQPGEGWPVRLSSGNDFAIDPSWSPDGQWLAWHEWDDPDMPWDSSRIAVRRADGTGAIRVVAGTDDDDSERYSVQQPRFSPDGELLSYLSDQSGFHIPWAVDVSTFGDPAPLVAGDDALVEYGDPTWGGGQRSYVWTADAETIVACRNHGGWGRLVVIDTETGDVGDLVQATFTALHAADDGVVGVSTGPDQPSAITYMNPDTGFRTLAQATPEGLASAGTDPELVQWESDGHTIYGRLYRTTATSDEVPPLLVWIHGGPTGQSPATLYGRFGYFLQRGWSVLVPDYRGSSGWGRDHLQALQGQWGIADVADVAAGIRAAIDWEWGRADAVVAFGGSAGGFTTLLLLAEHPELCAAGVTPYPVCDLDNFAADTWRYEAHYMDSLVGSLPEAHDLYVERSPIRHAAKITAPLFIMHGTDDVVVPIAQSLEFADVARRAGATVEFAVYEGEGHGWRRSETIIKELTQTDSFLRRHVLHLPAPIEGIS